MVTARANGKLTNREHLIYRTATSLVLAVMVFSIINFEKSHSLVEAKAF
jgi:hypothetical protein